MSLRSGGSSHNGVAVQIEGYCPIEVGAIYASSCPRESRQSFQPRKTKRISRSYRNDRELRPRRVHQLLRGGIGAPVMANLQQGGPGMLNRGDAALHALLGVSFEQQ